MQQRPPPPPSPASVDSASPAAGHTAPLATEDSTYPPSVDPTSPAAGHAAPEPPAPPPPRRTALLLARAAALVFSIATVTVLAVQAGLSGCASTTPEPEYQFAEDPLHPSSPDPAQSATSTARPGKPTKPHYFPGPKAPAGNWAYPDEDERPAQAPARTKQLPATR